MKSLHYIRKPLAIPIAATQLPASALAEEQHNHSAMQKTQ
jgi:hypothetical protein